MCYQFNGLGPMPEEPVRNTDHPPFTIVYDDLVEACRLALEIDRVPDYFQAFNMGSYLQQGKYTIDKARRMLGYEPRTNPPAVLQTARGAGMMRPVRTDRSRPVVYTK